MLGLLVGRALRRRLRCAAIWASTAASAAASSLADGEDRLPLLRRHPFAFELHEALGAIALFLAHPTAVELDPPESLVGLGVAGHDLDHLRPGLARLRRERLAFCPARELAPAFGVGAREVSGARAIDLERRGALLDADHGRHLDPERPGADVDGDRLLRLLDDLARDLAAPFEIDLVSEERSGEQGEHQHRSFHLRPPRTPRRGGRRSDQTIAPRAASSSAPRRPRGLACRPRRPGSSPRA